MKVLDALNQVLDSISSGCFKTLGNGQHAYFPNGALGAGYVLPDETSAERVRQSIRRFWYGVLALCAVSGPVATALFDHLSPWVAGAICAGVLGALALSARLAMTRAAAGLEATDAKITVAESVSTQFKAVPRWFAIFQVAFSALMLTAGIFMIRDGTSTSDFAWGVAATAMFSALFVVSSIGLWARGRSA